MGNKPALARRAWKLLRLALLWTRKGTSFRHHITRLLSTRRHHSSHLGYYRERELSFDETPTFRFRFHRPHFQCISPTVSFQEDNIAWYNDNEDSNGSEERLELEAAEEQVEEDKEKGIDDKAEEFIVRFYDQIKLQRQVSVLSYNEMIYRGTS